MKLKWMLAIVLLFTLIGCGGPQADVPIFMMSSNGIPSEVGDKLQAALQGKLGETPTVKLNTSPIFSMDKLIVEIAAGDNGILIVPTEQFKLMVKQTGCVPLDDVLNKDDFPEGVLAAGENGEGETHLYGVPLEKVKWMTDLKLNGKDLVAFVPVNAKDKEKSIQVMKIIAQK
ncbi:hypothetical protein [Paenibacillus hamazuiensis]|uniref:hypothetical protein n=1 Tax=Paenibacillus hamazuiensis TaxID=2936508 RepID=UPI00200E1C11|nr:hypothetical protein [Paenibacillus hamazuiensis]